MKYDKTVKKKKPGEALDLQNHIAPPGSTPFPHTVPPAASHTAVKFSMYSNPQTAAKSLVRLFVKQRPEALHTRIAGPYASADAPEKSGRN